MTFYIEFETQPFRSIDYTEIKADSEGRAIEWFHIANASSTIRKIEGYHK